MATPAQIPAGSSPAGPRPTTALRRRGAPARGASARGGSSGSRPGALSGRHRAASPPARQNDEIIVGKTAAAAPRPGSASSGKRPATNATVPPAAGSTAESGTTAAAARPRGHGSRSARSQAAKEPKSTKLSRRQIVLASVVLLALLGAVLYGPVTRGLALHKLNSFKNTPGKLKEAKEAADAYMALVDSRPNYVEDAIVGNYGPVETQIYMAQKCKMFYALLHISDRTLSDPPLQPGAKAVKPDPTLDLITQAQRALALSAAAAIFNPQTMDTVLPEDLNAWAKDPHLSDAVSIAAMQLLATAPNNALVKEPTPSEVLQAIASAPGQVPARITGAITGISLLATSDNLGYCLNLLSGSLAETAVANVSLREHLVAFATPYHAKRLIELLSSTNGDVRALALAALGGPNMHLGESVADELTRTSVASSILPKLTADTPPTELAAALKAVNGMRLRNAHAAVIALLPKLAGLNLPGITPEFLSGMLGQALICQSTTGSAVEDSRKASEDLILGLGNALDDNDSRSVAARSLALIRDPTYLSLRAAMSKLVEHGDDTECMTALDILVNQTFNRPDVTKLNGSDLGKWKAFFDQDRPHYERVIAIKQWLATHTDIQQIGDGQHRAALGEAKEFLDAAHKELSSWLTDPGFLAPMGLTMKAISRLDQDIASIGLAVRHAYVGSSE